MSTNKRKIINDPIYGFVTIPNELIYDLINHPYFQRLRRIKQLGLTNLVYPGALHTPGAQWKRICQYRRECFGGAGGL